MMQPDWLYFQNWVTVLSFSDLQTFLRWFSVNLVSTSLDVSAEIPLTPTKLFISLLNQFTLKTLYTIFVITLRFRDLVRSRDQQHLQISV